MKFRGQPFGRLNPNVGSRFARRLIHNGALMVDADFKGNEIRMRDNGAIAFEKTPSRRDLHRAEVVERKSR